MPEIAEPDEMSDAFMPADDDEPKDKDDSDTETKKEETAADSVDEQNAEDPTALLPKSALGKNVKAGDKITLTVTKLHGEEVMVSISNGKKKSKEKESANDELDSMSANY